MTGPIAVPLGVGGGILGGEGVTAYLHPSLSEILVVADVIFPLVIVVIRLTAILCGSVQTCERVFRLLRWVASRPEPAAPDSRN